jgi:hypothetical protein
MKTSLLCTSCYASVEIHSKIILNTYLFLYLFLYFFLSNIFLFLLFLFFISHDSSQILSEFTKWYTLIRVGSYAVNS